MLAGLAPSSQTVGSNKDDQEPPKVAPAKAVDQMSVDQMVHFIVLSIK